eukprot:TRINITY_DN12825_c0_g2_i1.p1 TRINITY_DN12825_c0_g2~~TRINITY_DN12825_c0_g2_i1.p1  ORF type:complete len:1642 (+),score=367.69 TRINITY_DN12825_c0_g2_i1:95-5020(+)
MAEYEIEMSDKGTVTPPSPAAVQNTSLVSPVDMPLSAGDRRAGRQPPFPLSSVASPCERFRTRDKQYLAKEALRGGSLRGMDTTIVNSTINETAVKVHKTAGHAISRKKAVFRALGYITMQPYFLLCFLCIAALVFSAYSDIEEYTDDPTPQSAHETRTDAPWLILEAAVVATVLILHTSMDVTLYLRRVADVYQKFTGLIDTGRSLVSGNSEYLAGLRDADSCRMLSVLRNAGDVSNKILLPGEHDCGPWTAHETQRNAVRTTFKLDRPFVGTSDPQPTDVHFEVEVWCSSAAFHPVAFQYCGVNDSKSVTFHANSCNPEGGWKQAEWQKLGVATEVDCTTTSEQGSVSVLHVAAVPYHMESTEVIKIRKVSVLHKAWRWRSVPEAMTVVKDRAMDIGKMEMFDVKREVLMDCLVRVFLPNRPKDTGAAVTRTGSSIKSPDHCSPGSCTPTSVRDDQQSPFWSPSDQQVSSRHFRVESEADAVSHTSSIEPHVENAAYASEEEEDIPSVRELEDKTSGMSRPTSSQNLLFLSQRCLAFIAAVLVIIVVACNVLRSSIEDTSHLSWYYTYVHGPACIVLAALPIGTTVVLRMIDCYANACLRSMMEMQDKTLSVTLDRAQARGVQNTDTSMSTDSSYSSTYTSQATEDTRDVAGGDIFAARGEGDLMLGKYNSNLSGVEPPPGHEDAGLVIDTLSHPSINRRMIAKHMWAIATNTVLDTGPKDWWGARYDLVHSRNACQVLGSMTVLSCTDKAGILSEVVPVPEKVLVMKRKAEGWDDGHGAEEYQEMAFLILEMHNDDSAENLLQFADPEWRKHIPQLKPLGLTAALHCMQHLEEQVEKVPTPQRPTKPSKHNHKKRKNKHSAAYVREQLHFDDTILWGKYLYFLGKEIGFSVQLLHALGFKVMKRIHTLRPMETFKKNKKTAKGAEMYEKTANYDPTLDGRQQMASLVVIDPEGNWQLLSIGAPQFILEYTPDYWNGEEVLPLGPRDKRELHYCSNEWRRQRDLVTVAFAYRPLPQHYQEFIMSDKSGEAIHILESDKEKHQNGDEFDIGNGSSGDEDSFGEEETSLDGLAVEQIYQRLQKKQIFLGMVGSRMPPKPMVQNLLVEFQKAGIRFIHFNNGNERMTKAFGEKLGLWTTANDWNCCISLDAHGATLGFSSIKARLPAGIKAIRNHIIHTDNVPLLVPLFCDSHPVAIKQMIGILQENSEVVCCVGSCLNHTNTASFMQADFGIATMPTCNTKLMHQNHAFTSSRAVFGLPGCPIGSAGHNKKALDELHESFQTSLKSLFNLGSLISLPCAMSLTPTEYPLYFILCLVKQARLQLHCMLKIAEVLVSWSACWCLCTFVCSLMMFPPVIRLTQLCWQLYFLLPFMSLALYEPFESLMCKKVMKIHPNKNDAEELWNVFKHLVKLWVARYVPTSSVMLAVFVGSLWYSSGKNPGDLMPPSREVLEDPGFQNALQYAQHSTMVSAVLFFSMHSVGALSRHLQLKLLEFNEIDVGKKKVQCALFRRKLGSEHYNPFEFSSFFTLLLMAWVFQITFSYFSVAHWPPGRDAEFTTGHPVYLYGGVIAYMIFIVFFDNFLKRYRRKRYLSNQTWRRLSFDTRLGMHSPRGDDSGDEDKGALKEAKQDTKTYWDSAKFFSI